MIDAAHQVLGYLFRDEALLRAALTHASSADHRLQSNERLEFLGDAILGYVVCEELFRAYPDRLEGDLTKIKSAVVSRRACAQVTQSIHLEDLLNLGKGMSSRPGLPASVAAAVFESIIAAIYLDGGMDAAREFILRHLRPFIEDAANSDHQQNEVCVEINGRRFDSAWANNKKQAEQGAALAALCGLGLAGRGTGEVQLTREPDPATVAARLADWPVHGASG